MSDIEDILKATIQVKVIEAFNSTPEMIEKLVCAALSKEVDQYGEKPRQLSFGTTTMPYMEWLVGFELRNAASECGKEYIASHKDEIAERVNKSMESGDFITPMANVISNVLSEEYRWNVELKIAKD